MFAIGELKGLVRQVLHELHRIVRWLALSIGSHDKEDTRILWDLVEVLKVILLGVTNQRGKTKLGLCLLGQTNGVFFGGTRLRTVKDDNALFLSTTRSIEGPRERQYESYPFLHFCDKVPRVAVAIRGFRWSSRDDFLFGGEYLITEEISPSEDYPDCEDSDVRGRRSGHCRYREN